MSYPTPISSSRPLRGAPREQEGDPCSACGGYFFTDTSANKFSVTSYGARLIGGMSQSAIICVGCGEPVIPPNLNSATPGTEREALFQSLKLGQEYRRKQRLNDKLKNFASITELEELKSLVDAQQELIEGLVMHIESIAHQLEDQVELAVEETDIVHNLVVEEKAVSTVPDKIEKIVKPRVKRDNINEPTV